MAMQNFSDVLGSVEFASWRFENFEESPSIFVENVAALEELDIFRPQADIIGLQDFIAPDGQKVRCFGREDSPKFSLAMIACHFLLSKPEIC